MQSRHMLWTGALLLVGTLSCSNTSRPTVRVRNDRATKVNVQFKDARANILNVNDVSGGSSSVYSGMDTGPYTVTAVIQNESVSPTTTFTALKDGKYTLVIVSGATPALRIDQP